MPTWLRCHPGRRKVRGMVLDVMLNFHLRHGDCLKTTVCVTTTFGAGQALLYYVSIDIGEDGHALGDTVTVNCHCDRGQRKLSWNTLSRTSCLTKSMEVALVEFYPTKSVVIRPWCWACKVPCTTPYELLLCLLPVSNVTTFVELTV